MKYKTEIMNKPIINNDVIPPIRSGSHHFLCLSIFIFALIIAQIPNIAIAKIGRVSTFIISYL